MAVTNDEEFKAWLEGQPREVCVAIAHRAAMRVLPFAMDLDQSEGAERLVLLTCQCALTSGVGAVRPTRDVMGVAGKAHLAAHNAISNARAADETTRAATISASYAVYAAETVSAANEAALVVATATTISNARAAAYADTEVEGDLLMRTAIPLPDELKTLHGEVAAKGRSALDAGGPWAFWADWYAAAMRGDPLPWELQEQIALIPDDVWEAGIEAVAKEIRKRQIEFLAKSLPQAGGLEFDADAALFRKIVPEVARPQLLGATLQQIEGALEDVLADPSNGLHERSREVQVLTRMLERFGNDPQRIEMDCTSVYGSLTRQLASEDLPPSEHNLALRDAVDQTAEGIRATDPEIAENRRILSGVKFKQMDEEAIGAFEEALPTLEAVSEEELGQEFREDILFLSEQMRLPERPVLENEPRNPGIKAAYDEEIRVFKRIADMAILARSVEAVDKAAEGLGISRGSFLSILVGLVGIAVSLI